MLKKIVMVNIYLLSLTWGNAQSMESEIGINIGMNSTNNDDGYKLENPRVGVTYQNNKYVVKPRVDVAYVNIKNDQANALIKGSINGVYEYENDTYTIPYALAGVGYEYVSGATDGVFESHPFVQAGVGVRIDLDEGYKARLEGKMLQILGSKNHEGNEAIVTAGLSFPLGYTKPVRESTPIRKVVPVQRYSVPAPVVKSVPKIIYANNNECSIKISLPDLDRDGVEDKVDQCPATPCNFTVDYYGCPIKATLEVHFETNSADIRDYSMSKVQRFADFLIQHPGSLVRIVGHTDSRGTTADNYSLSYRRANVVVNELINLGVSSSRLTAVGKGETMAIASNKTASGRAKNRRIEAELSYPKGRN